MNAPNETSEIPATPENQESPTFDAFPLSDAVRQALDEIGYAKPTPVQQATYQLTADRRDLIVQARTGTGKTAAFAIPIIDKVLRDEPRVQVLVLAPTRELALQSAREMQRIGKYKGTRVAAIYGGAPMGKQVEELRGGTNMVSGTPGRVLDHLKRGTLDLSQLRVLVLDEMDEMLSMGFARELNAIMEFVPAKRQTLCFSATVDDPVQRVAEKYLDNPELISLSSDAIGPKEVQHYVYLISGLNRVRDLIKILETEDPESAIIFCNQRSETERVAAELQQAGFDADWLNGDLPQQDREKVMARTREGKLRYLVATDVAARGIDISHLTHIINYTFPESVVAYVHRTGRTGRAGRSGTAVSLVSPPELGELYYLRLEYKIFPIERYLPTSGEITTRKEADRIELLNQAFEETPTGPELSMARRLLTYPGAERIVAGLLRGFFGARGIDVDEEAAAARRSRRPTPIEGERRSPPTIPAGRRYRQARAEIAEPEPPRRRRERSGRPVDTVGQIEQEEEYDENAEPAEELAGTLYLNIGKRDGIRIGEIARLLREKCGLSRRQIGRIRVRDRYVLVAVPLALLDSIVSKLEGLELHDRKLAPERARIDQS